MDPFVDQLRQLCVAHPTRSKWVFVPTHALGRTLGDRLVLEGTPWANLRFVTPLDLALRMGAPFLVERGIDPAAARLEPGVRGEQRAGADRLGQDQHVAGLQGALGEDAG